jgi:hypothetical protein
VGACGYALSYLILNGLATRGSWLLGHMSGVGNPQAWLLGARVSAEPGLEEELDRADRW